jgi:hypothetical protein
MSFAFVCAKQDDGAWPEDQHETVGVMRRCPRCDRNAVAGYQCETCEHEDVDPVDQLVGHGEGKCEVAA